MLSQWREFLTAQGGVWAGARLCHFADPAAEARVVGTTPLLADLSHWACLSAEGEDAARFLQGQLSCDVLSLERGAGCLGSYCNLKGRVVASFYLVRTDEQCYRLFVHADLGQTLKEQLERYAIFDKVAFELEPESPLRLGLAAAEPEAELSDMAPAELEAGVSAYRLPGQPPRWLLLSEPGPAQPLWQACAARARPVGADAWHLHAIRAGIGHVEAASSEQFLPQMLNYDRLGGVSFDKGCFRGQEVVARAHYRGQLKQRLLRGVYSWHEPHAPGTRVMALDGDRQASAGHLLSSAAAGDGEREALLVLRLDRQTHELRLGDGQGPEITLAPLPYAIS